MELATVIQIGLFIIVGYICVYALVDRICKCAETCAAIKSVGPQALSDPEGFATVVKEMSKK